MREIDKAPLWVFLRGLPRGPRSYVDVTRANRWRIILNDSDTPIVTGDRIRLREHEGIVIDLQTGDPALRLTPEGGVTENSRLYQGFLAGVPEAAGALT